MAAAKQPPSAKGAAVRWMRVLLGAVGVVALGFAGVDPATLGLAVAAAALLFCLSVLYRMVRVLARPAVEYDLERDGTLAAAGIKQLREERRRLLRAINELKFDHDMGKLSDADYKAVRHGYELRAVEVMRALEAEPDLHPELRRELARRGLVDDAEVPAKAEPEAAVEEAKAPEASKQEKPARARNEQPPAPEPESDELTCAACSKPNDRDAKFCKHCGKELVA